MNAPLADSLAAAPAVRAAREALGDRDDAWVVGGAVRDAALGRAVVDVDLVVAGEAKAPARDVGRAVGGPTFSLSEYFGTWRALGDGWHVDVTSMRGDRLEADLAQRDFTMNSMAVPLADPAAGPIDPGGGLADLDDRLLRATSERSFTDDPLRVLRAAQHRARDSRARARGG